MRPIDADRLIARLEDDAKHMEMPLAKMFTYGAINDIKDEPTVVVPRWIPCSERMPEEDIDVLIAYRYREGEGDISHTEIDITSYGDVYFGGNPIHEAITGKRMKRWRQPFAYFSSNYEVVAWMPLPEPYKGGD